MHVPAVPTQPFQLAKQRTEFEQIAARAPCQCSTHELPVENMSSRNWRLDTPKRCQMLLRKEVIQPHLPVRLPCYDLVLITDPTFDGSLHKG